MATSTELAIQRMQRNQERLKRNLEQLQESLVLGNSKVTNASLNWTRSPFLTRKRARTMMLSPTDSRNRIRTPTNRARQARDRGSLPQAAETVPRTPFSPALTLRSGIVTPTPQRQPLKPTTANISELNSHDEISRTMLETRSSTLEEEEPVTPVAKKNRRRLSSTPKGKGKCAKTVSFAESCEQPLEERQPLLRPREDFVPEDNASLSTISGSLDSVAEGSNMDPFVDRSLEEAILHSSRPEGPSRTKTTAPPHHPLSISFVQEDSGLPTEDDRPKTKSQREEELMRSLQASRGGGANLERSMRALRSTRRTLDYGGLDPSLGYDWIAGAVDAEEVASVVGESDEYFRTLKEFRRVNREDCVRPKLLSPLTSITPKTKRKYLTENRGCDHDKTRSTTTYVLNDRLFPVPVHEFEEEGSCPVCSGSHCREEEEGPTRFIRVSVPRVSLQTPHKWSSRHGKRTSTDMVESMGLSMHCQPGWESARPPVIVPCQDSVDLASSLLQGPLGSRGISQDLLNISRSTKYRHSGRTIH